VSGRFVVHLDECEHEKSETWRTVLYQAARDKGAEMCPDAAYMADELFLDEPVLLERRTAPDPQTEYAKVQADRLSTARRVWQQAVDEKAREMVEQDAWLDEGGRATLDAGLSAVLRLGRHDGDCQAFQHTYTASQGEPGVYPHGSGMVDAVGANGRRLLVRDDPDGVYIGGARFTTGQLDDLIAVLTAFAQRRHGRGEA
jgi:hypothetical protein